MSFRSGRNAFLVLLAISLITCSGCSQNKAEASGTVQSSSAVLSSVAQASSAASSSSSGTNTSASEVSSGNSTVSSRLPSVKPDPATSVAGSSKSDFSVLDDAVFIGDSVTLKLKNYVTAKRKTEPGFFGKAQFLAAGSMGSGNALMPLADTSIHPPYNGTKLLLEDSVTRMGAKRVYIMLGTNDIALYGIDDSVRNMSRLLARITAKSPNTVIFVQSATPMLAEKQRKELNNPNLIRYDNALSRMCKEKNYYFVDVASALRDKNGNLPPEYCSDPNDLGIHFTDKACEIWIDYLLTHTVKH